MKWNRVMPKRIENLISGRIEEDSIGEVAFELGDEWWC